MKMFDSIGYLISGNFLRRDKFRREFMLLARCDAIVEFANSLKKDDSNIVILNNYAKYSKDALQKRKIELGWRNILQAEKIIMNYQNDQDMAALSLVVLADSSLLLPPADCSVISEMLKKSDSMKDNNTPGWQNIVARAKLLFEERSIFYYDRREKNAIGIFMMILSILISCTCVAVIFSFNKDSVEIILSKQLTLDKSPHWVWAVLFFLGCLGGSLSAVIGFTNLGRFIGAFEGMTVTLARPIVGGASGVISSLVLQAGLLDLKNGAAVGLVAFVFGFSEKLLIGTVQRFEGTSKTP